MSLKYNRLSEGTIYEGKSGGGGALEKIKRESTDHEVSLEKREEN